MMESEELPVHEQIVAAAWRAVLTNAHMACSVEDEQRQRLDGKAPLGKTGFAYLAEQFTQLGTYLASLGPVPTPVQAAKLWGGDAKEPQVDMKAVDRLGMLHRRMAELYSHLPRIAGLARRVYDGQQRPYVAGLVMDVAVDAIIVTRPSDILKISRLEGIAQTRAEIDAIIREAYPPTD